MRSALAVGLGLLIAAPAALPAQEFLVRLDAKAQGATYRGIRKDSIPASQVVTGPGGGPETPDGYDATCVTGQAVCYFYRAGDARRGGPFVTSADVSAWGFGLRGLSLHANARLGVDLGASDVWPGTDPAVQLLEGYAEYASERITGRLGRQAERSRLGYYGYDGARLAYRVPSAGLTAIGYGGLGLARGVALPVTSDALNPLDDFQPRQRQLLVGGALEWQGRLGDARFDYEREVDRDTRNFVSERVALSANFRPFSGWSLAGGADYDLARGWWGSGDLTLRYGHTRFGAAAGIRRYRPYFDLWTIWELQPGPIRGLEWVPLGFSSQGTHSPGRWGALLVCEHGDGNPAGERRDQGMALECGGHLQHFPGDLARRRVPGGVRTGRGFAGWRGRGQRAAHQPTDPHSGRWPPGQAARIHDRQPGADLVRPLHGPAGHRPSASGRGRRPL